MIVEILLAGVLAAGAEHAILDEVNAHRRQLGLRALDWNDRAAGEARRHCGALLRSAAADPHAGFQQRAARLMRETGAKSVAENVLLMEGGGFTPRQALEGWLKSTGHRRSIEGDFLMSGVGVAQRGSAVCAVQIFLGP
ncbi:MAG: hypothetical protein KatS3mg004_1833 [Bryobacteraceae bacterium]|nr:MAG: hypothetical protein KatS3mg004_1833 [Bryobacteraceae bacterium]